LRSVNKRNIRTPEPAKLPDQPAPELSANRSNPKLKTVLDLS
jgi:hypothetical protein